MFGGERGSALPCTHNDLLIRGDELQRLLNDPAAVHLQRQRQHVTSDPLGQRQLLVQAAELEPERTGRQGGR